MVAAPGGAERKILSSVALQVHRVIPAGLPAGTYTLQIRNNYDPFIFQDGSKEFYLATVDPTLGGRNPLLAWSYIGVGSLCLVMGLAFACKVQQLCYNTAEHRMVLLAVQVVLPCCCAST